MRLMISDFPTYRDHGQTRRSDLLDTFVQEASWSANTVVDVRRTFLWHKFWYRRCSEKCLHFLITVTASSWVWNMKKEVGGGGKAGWSLCWGGCWVGLTVVTVRLLVVFFLFNKRRWHKSLICYVLCAECSSTKPVVVCYADFHDLRV